MRHAVACANPRAHSDYVAVTQSLQLPALDLNQTPGYFSRQRLPSGPPSGQRYRRRDARLIADHARGMALAGQVFCQVDVAGPEAMDCAVAEADLHLTGQGDHELTPWRRMPIEEVARRQGAELNSVGL